MSRTVIFDLGGVLVKLDWEKVCVPLTGLSSKNANEVRQEVVNGPLVQLSMLGRIGPQEFHKSLCDKLGIAISYQEFVGIWVRLLSADDDMVPLVERLKQNNRLVLASNTDKLHYTYSNQHFDVMRNFDECFLSYEMGLLKPDPAFFHHVLASLHNEPVDCVFIDDRPENIESARSVGITALLFGDVQGLQSALTAIL